MIRGYSGLKKEMRELLEYCEDKGIRVKFVTSKVLYDYAGMNPGAAKIIGFKDIKDNEILIDKTLPEYEQCDNIKHELVEKNLMDKGMPYWPSHLKALRAEKKSVNVDFPDMHKVLKAKLKVPCKVK